MEVAYFITSCRPHRTTAAQLLALIRGHWVIENGLHRVKDVTLGEDHSLIHQGQGPTVMALLRDHLAPRLIGRDPALIEQIWRDLMFATHATTVGAITSLALAAIDTALWDLRCRRDGHGSLHGGQARSARG